MITTVSPSTIRGEIYAPASKSSMQRACAAALLSKGETIIRRPGHSNDDKAAVDVIKKLGAKTEWLESGDLRVNSHGIDPAHNEINCGESGLGIRMFTPLAALSDRQIQINGTGSLVRRPMNFFDEIFPQLGIQIESNEGKLPLRIQGPLKPRDITIDGSLSSQFLTGLLMAYAAAGARNVTITVRDLKSRPYIALTLAVLKAFGVNVVNRDFESFYFDNNVKQLRPAIYSVEGDWSGASFLLVAGAVAGSITVRGLELDSTQADKAILMALQSSGAIMSVRDSEIEIRKTNLTGFQFDATDCPDLFPPLVALAAYCNGTSVIQGVSRLAHKESNRGLTLQSEFAKLGVKINLQDDLMVIEGTGKLNGATVHSNHDHRIAMACAVAALAADGPVQIEDAEAIDKSYPDFYDHIQSLGAAILHTQTINQ